MALTKISGNVVQQNNFTLSGVVTVTDLHTDNINTTGIVTTVDLHASNVNTSGVVTAIGGLKGIGISSAGTAIHSGVITSLNFVGSGNTFAVSGGVVDISIAGGGGGAVGTGTDKVFYENDVAVSQSYEITSGKNAMTAGPITLGAGVTVTIPAGSVWSVI